MKTNVAELMDRLYPEASPENVTGMARFGINPQNTLGISIYTLRKIAKDIGCDHALAQGLWETGVHEARILASYVAEVDRVDEALLERWVSDFDSWDVCDQVCGMFAATSYAYQKDRGSVFAEFLR